MLIRRYKRSLIMQLQRLVELSIFMYNHYLMCN